MDAWPRGIDAITLFIDDLEATKHFYREVFGLPLKFEDDDSAVPVAVSTATPPLTKRPHSAHGSVAPQEPSPCPSPCGSTSPRQDLMLDRHHG
ncbi:MAG: VOC family protein [Chloroflexi bacterium]|nr:VOC family protein [Chloroflexota bacterium]